MATKKPESTADKKGRSPAFQFYPDKYDSHTRHLSDYAYRIYHRLLCWMWLHSPDYCSCTDDAGGIAIILAEPRDKIESALSEIQNEYMPLLKAEDGRYMSGGLAKEGAKQKISSDRARAAADARWGKKKDAKTMHPQCARNADACKSDAQASETDAAASSEQCIPIPTPIPTPVPKRDIDEFSILWNSAARRNGLPTIRGLSPERTKKLRARCKDGLTENWAEVEAELGRLADFAKEWMSFDWVMNSKTNMDKLLEGNYRERQTSSSQPAHRQVSTTATDEEYIGGGNHGY